MRVSVVIPTYNRPKFLERVLTSVENQSYRNFEVIVIDDASVTSKENQRVVSKFPSVTYLCNETNRGAPFTRNRGIKIASGELIAVVDDDDEWLPNKLKMQVERFDHGKGDLGIVYTWTQVIKDGKVSMEYKPEEEGRPLSKLLQECFIPSPSVMIRKTALIKAGLFDEAMPSCQDWDLWTRVVASGYSLGVVKSFQTLYHKHDLESIGNSPNALKGYEKYYDKHMPLFLKYHPFFYLKRLIKKLIKR